MEPKSFFQVTYRNPEKLSENMTLKCQSIGDSSLGLGFISLSQFIFESNSIIVDPKEDQIRQKFQNTKSLHLSIHSIISIEEIGLENAGLHFINDKSNLLVLRNGPDQTN